MPDGRYFTAGQFKPRLGRLLSPYWSTSRRTYAGFSDEKFYYLRFHEDGSHWYSVLNHQKPLGERLPKRITERDIEFMNEAFALVVETPK